MRREMGEGEVERIPRIVKGGGSRLGQRCSCRSLLLHEATRVVVMVESV